MFFYVLFALGLLFRSSLRGVLITIGLLLALTIAGGVHHFTSLFGWFYTSPLVLEFGLGMAIAVAFRHAPKFSAPGWRYGLIALILLGLGLLTRPPFWGIGHFDRLLSHGVASALIVCAALALERRGDFVKGGVLVALGDASYSMYLTHPFVAQLFLKLFSGVASHGLGSVLLILLCLAAVMAVALAVHRWVELPLTRAARHLMGIKPRPKVFHVA
jgi:peptidoglycan/LPS O-acetylase OafA/YrhL